MLERTVLTQLCYCNNILSFSISIQIPKSPKWNVYELWVGAVIVDNEAHIVESLSTILHPNKTVIPYPNIPVQNNGSDI